MRSTRQLHPDLQVIIPIFLYECSKQNLQVRITECFRTVAEQEALYAQGRTTPGSIVTNCKGSEYSSPHQWGVAFDICRNDGKYAYDDSDGWFEKVGKIGRSLGLQWGGVWSDFVDKPHFQLDIFFDSKIQTVANSIMKKLYGSYAKFRKSWTKSKITQEWGNLNLINTKTMLAKHICSTKKAVYVYKQENTGKYVCKYAKGKSVYIVEDNGRGMSKCLLNSGKVGYIYNGSLSKKGISVYRKCRIIHNTYVYKSTNKASKIGVDKSKKTKVIKGSNKYTLYSTGTNWARISYGGSTVWISKKRIKVV